jgi:hypothetical protein
MKNPRLGSFAARCGGQYALPVDQRLKLLGDSHVQLDDAFIALALDAIPASDRKEAIFLGMVEDREQLAFGIDQHGDGSVFLETAEPQELFNASALMSLRRL